MYHHGAFLSREKPGWQGEHYSGGDAQDGVSSAIVRDLAWIAPFGKCMGKDTNDEINNASAQRESLKPSLGYGSDHCRDS